jgi:hypothetical protein
MEDLMQTFLSRTSVVDELAARLSARRISTARRSGAYQRLALAIVHPAASSPAPTPVGLRQVQRPVAAA